jgi:hypothetical protein
MISLLILIAIVVVLAISAMVVFIALTVTKGKLAKVDRFNWWLPLFAAVGALILFVPVIATLGYDGGEFLYILLIAPVVSISLLALAFFRKKRARLAILSMLVVFSATSWGLLKNAFEVRSDARWLLHSKDYKTRVMAKSTANGELRHIEWDGWGFPGAGDTVVYLVFDPSDSLSTVTNSHPSGKYGAVYIHCEVDRIRRLESHFYAVQFYTDTDWDSCK